MIIHHETYNSTNERVIFLEKMNETFENTIVYYDCF